MIREMKLENNFKLKLSFSFFTKQETLLPCKKQMILEDPNSFSNSPCLQTELFLERLSRQANNAFVY